MPAKYPAPGKVVTLVIEGERHRRKVVLHRWAEKKRGWFVVRPPVPYSLGRGEVFHVTDLI